MLYSEKEMADAEDDDNEVVFVPNDNEAAQHKLLDIAYQIKLQSPPLQAE